MKMSDKRQFVGASVIGFLIEAHPALQGWVGESQASLTRRVVEIAGKTLEKQKKNKSVLA
jgi:hypothetical protein